MGYEDSEEEPLSEKWGKVTDADEHGVSEKASIGYETFIPTFDIFESSYSYIKDQLDNRLYFDRLSTIVLFCTKKKRFRTAMKA